MPLLILGGTADGRYLAEFFHQQGIQVIYSVAGLVRMPQVNCAVVSGGFTQFGGLLEYIKKNAIIAILDVTHPYAQTISTTALNIARHYGIPCWRFHREKWQVQPNDNWVHFSDWSKLAMALSCYQRVLLTCGQLNEAQLNQLSSYKYQQQWLRTAVKPKVHLPSHVSWIKAIGPFILEDEQRLMQAHGIDVLVSKNSGGDATYAKLQVARQLGIPVFMIDRPLLPDADIAFYSHKQCQDYILERLTHD